MASLVALSCLFETLEAYAAPLKLRVTSSGFKNGKMMPAKYGCNGAGVSPPLAWSKVPAGTQSIAILMVDPKGGPFHHWGTYNIPPNRRSIRAKFKNTETNETVNDWGFLGYGEPCPPGATHPYIFYVVALDTTVMPNTEGDYLASSFYDDVFTGALSSHVLARGSIKGMYYSEG